MPDLRDRLEAAYLLDKVNGSEAIQLPHSGQVKQKSIQKPGKMCIIGSDVVSLFPSLKNVETGRLARYALLDTEVEFENFDYLMGLRYLKIVGGDALLNRARLGRLAPRWLGKREDLTTIGGSKSKDPKSWRDTTRDIFKTDRKRIIAAVMEVLINVVMSSHVYSFAGKIFLQSDGGPIGLRSTATLASLAMKLWDLAWMKLVKKESIKVDEFFRYVDDIRNFLAPLCEGWRWNGCTFEFSKIWETEDLNSNESDEFRTMKELNKAMCSLISYLQFESEVGEMHESQKLPTLDTNLWIEGGKVMYEFYEKPTVPNRVIQKSTALSEQIIRSSVNQGVVRRLLNCSMNLPISVKQNILSDYAQKLVNSGFSVKSCQLTLVHGVSRYLDLVEKSNLPENDKDFKPLYYGKDFNKLERKLNKYLAKSGWYQSDDSKNCSWRSKLPFEWRGGKPIQRKVPEMNFTSVMQVPSSANGRLLKELARIEPRVAKTSKYQIKLVEKGGRQLSKMFSKDLGNVKCPRLDCVPCQNASVKGTSMCKTKSVVYESVCSLCEIEHKLNPGTTHRGKYIGQTARTLYERSLEHLKSLRNFEMDSFMLKHWSICHKELEKPPKFDFKVIKCHSDPMSRLIHESVRICSDATMNSKAEFIGYRVARLKVERSTKETLKEIEESDSQSKWELSQMLEVVDRSKSLGLFSSDKSNPITYRKRKMPSSNSSDESTQVDHSSTTNSAKNTKMMVSTRHGNWTTENAKKKPRKSSKMESVKKWLNSIENGAVRSVNSGQNVDRSRCNSSLNAKLGDKVSENPTLHRLENSQSVNSNVSVNEVKKCDFSPKILKTNGGETVDARECESSIETKSENKSCVNDACDQENPGVHRLVKGLSVNNGKSVNMVKKCESKAAPTNVKVDASSLKSKPLEVNHDLDDKSIRECTNLNDSQNTSKNELKAVNVDSKMGASVVNLECKETYVEDSSKLENKVLSLEEGCELVVNVNCVNLKPKEATEGNDDSLDSESSWFNENVKEYCDKEKLQAEWCESNSQKSDCESEASPVKFNSTTSSLLETFDMISENLAKTQSDDEKTQWLSWNISNATSVNDVIDQLWLFVNGELKFEKNMRSKLSEKLGFDAVKSVWLSMKNPEKLDCNKMYGLKRLPELSPAKPRLEKCENGQIMTPTSPDLEGLIGGIKNCELNGPTTVNDVSESLRNLDLDVSVGNVKKCARVEKHDFSVEKPVFGPVNRPQTPQKVDHRKEALLIDVVNGPENPGIVQISNYTSRNRVFAVNDLLCHSNPNSQQLAQSSGGSSLLEESSSRGDPIDGVVRQISSKGDTKDGSDGPIPAGSSPIAAENKAEFGENSLKFSTVLPKTPECKLLQGKKTKYFGVENLPVSPQ